MGLRHGQLEDSVQLHQFTHDSNEEMRWVKEREPAANSALLGDSLTTVQGLIKKHQVRESVDCEITCLYISSAHNVQLQW